MDYTFKAPSLAVIGNALAVLQASGLVGANSGPANMLGPFSVDDAKGNILFRYGVGRAAVGATAPDGSKITIPAIGEPDMVYITIRADDVAIPFDPAALGLIATTAEESAAVLGVWA
ncbi:hypothetical protein UFOVP1619_39 [uncultured Caudovirales phage]|uniref:Uncharacterized protein n=1 Tax=uncultured Caudovirales phage TaxID=2100421 RepID=A0A6J5SV76_9CAUD|nr:hypothetical protein UFOVP1619_39 [uncultured Caudovirales phage]